jgi:hypothetical protein
VSAATDFIAASDALEAAQDSIQTALTDDNTDGDRQNVLARANQAVNEAQKLLDGPSGNKALANALTNI